MLLVIGHIARIIHHFPQLTIIHASKRNESDIVFASDIEVAKVAEQVATSSQMSSSSQTESESDNTTDTEINTERYHRS